MNGIAIILRALYDGERRMERELLAAADRHRADHEVHHVATDVARWSHEHAERIARTARHYGLDLPGPAGEPGAGPSAPVGRHPAEQAPGTGLPLLDDLCGLHLAATGNSLHWEMLARLAQAAREDRLLGLATACHPQTLRQMRWTDTVIKTLSPQLLAGA
ncbi:hypothetical protein [Kitasatospora sp. NPDC093679]|uniref:hypothetical protein n=1 Tax=Kitasatospora sp. NPDC093679 TaxID=3154983 RepID=UPI0034311586